MGIGVGCVGLSVADFDRLTPDEFSAIADAWQQNRDNADRTAWEIARTSAAILIRPHITRSVTPERLLPLPWDKPAAEAQKKAPRLTKEQQDARFKEIVQRLG